MSGALYAWNPAGGDGTAINLATAGSLTVTGSASSWGINSDVGSLAPNGTYSTKAAAVAALTELLETAGYVTLT